MLSLIEPDMKPKLTSELAEFIGIMFGDGYMNHYSNGHYFIEIAGHSKKDLEYHKRYISNLVERLFNIRPTLVIRKDQNTLYSRISSKRIFYILQNLEFPRGKKINLIVPSWISKNRKFFISFLKGIYDTDGSMILRTSGQYSISLGLKEKDLILEIKRFLEEIGYFTSYSECTQKDKRGFTSTIHCIRINQKSLINKFKDEIDSSNPYKLKRLEIMAGNGTSGTFKS